MITRAQAEALLTLAESLEACERLGAYLVVPGRGEIVLNFSPDLKDVNVDLDAAEITGPCLRRALEEIMPTQEQS